MKEDYLNRMAKKIRNKLIYFIHLELKKKSKKNNVLLINSMTSKELNSKYEKCSDYCVERIETYSSSQINNGLDNNYFYVSLTYSSVNNKYHMLIDNRNNGQMIGENNIVGKYYKGNSVYIRTTTNENYNINKKDIELEKMIIGEKKFAKKKRVNYSSLNITKNILINDNENNNNLNNLNSDHNNHKNLNNINIDNEAKKKMQTNKIKKIKIQSTPNIYTIKLKNYCSTLKIIKKKKDKFKNQKTSELVSPAISEYKKKFKKGDYYTLKSGREESKILIPIINTKDNFNLRYQTEVFNTARIKNNNNNNNNSKLKSQILNLFKIPKKKILRKKKKPPSIEIPDKNTSPKKSSPKKALKKNSSPKKIIYTMRNNESQISKLIKKNIKKKITEGNINKKFISSSIINKRKNLNDNNIQDKAKNINNFATVVNTFKLYPLMNKKSVNRKYKRANTGNNKNYD